ncbi:Por secretion system C-terminal sorting domain-containing protein [Gracilimonas mengyeensis]|uniref:Por secretion system C-terminal sorting domain-containing protein n=2 Tax=Gracilimonas mengyeensis TaxID=1302730 RepID=A0A521F5J3_9BACT|nr:Por secretion system C-terminal sorting domain-containing protein [Gracilimonas mengyeensis]
MRIRVIAGILAMMFLTVLDVMGQDPAAVHWPLTDPSLGGTEFSAVIEGPLEANEMQLNNMEVNQYSGPNNSLRIRIEGNSWPANQTTEIDDVYLEFSVSPRAGATFFVDTLSLDIAGVSIDGMKASIYYSTDASFADRTPVEYTTEDESGNNYLPRDSLQTITAFPDLELSEDQSLFLRIYPWVDNDPNERTGKYIALQNVMLAGTTVGGMATLPEVATYNPGNVSTDYAFAGGNVSSDGGAQVTARGVVWNTAGEPVISDFKTEDGTGSGSFESQMTGLENGTIYYYRAYATNEAGTAYGREVSFTTLDEKTVPEVETGDITEVMVETALGRGEVTAWGGSEVTARGLVWSTEGEPTIEDFKSEAGSGLGEFVSTMYPLEAESRYYVRAYATNETGTGYGPLRMFLTQEPAPDITKVVAKDGSGDYTKVQDAFDEIPDNYTGQYTIFVKKGEYYEKLVLEENKVNVKLIGEHRDSTVLWYDDYAGIAGGTSQSYSVAINANDFVAENITFQNVIENDKSVSGQQAVALVTNGDRQAYYNVNILGFQDTFYARGSNGTGRIYIKNSLVEGSVDFIFGRNIVVFDSTEIRINRDGGTLTAAATDPESKYGFVFLDSRITADSIGFDGDPIEEFYLGRPWQGAPRTVFINTWYHEVLAPQGWLAWNVQPALYGEYNCSGPGCVHPDQRAGFSTQLSSEEAETYTLENIFSKESNPNFGRDWMPSPELTPVSINEASNINTPHKYELQQNYPNPFNPATKIGFTLPSATHISLIVYDLLGRKVATLLDEKKQAGHFTVQFDAGPLSSGIYLYQMKTDNFTRVNKMTLIK